MRSIGKKLMARRRLRPNRPVRVVVLGFMVIILLGAVLLSLPISSRTGESTPFVHSLFTATSATCVTGLVVYDTYQYWNGFGQAVILVLIQTGGLGFMSLAAIGSFLLRRKITLGERLTMTSLLNVSDLSGIVRLTRRVLIGTFAVELAGSLILTFRFIPDFGALDGIRKGVFHAISAFCNAGFDLMGQKGEFSSLTAYASDPIVNITICGLIVLGGLGFFVWNDVYSYKKGARLKPQTKIVLITTAILILSGTAFFLFFEYSNPATLGTMPFKDKLMASVFQSVTTRTAGFNTIDQATLTGSSKMLTVLLMLIGGSPGSTAGGVKTTTIALLFITAFSVMRGRSNITVFGRHIRVSAIMQAATILLMVATIIFFATFAICAIDQIPIIDALFEVTSAFGTVGLSASVTPTLSYASLLILASLMFLGRVGILTVTLSLTLRTPADSLLKYPDADISVG